MSGLKANIWRDEPMDGSSRVASRATCRAASCAAAAAAEEASLAASLLLRAPSLLASPNTSANESFPGLGAGAPGARGGGIGISDLRGGGGCFICGDEAVDDWAAGCCTMPTPLPANATRWRRESAAVRAAAAPSAAGTGPRFASASAASMLSSANAEPPAPPPAACGTNADARAARAAATCGTMLRRGPAAAAATAAEPVGATMSGMLPCPWCSVCSPAAAWAAEAKPSPSAEALDGAVRLPAALAMAPAAICGRGSSGLVRQGSACRYRAATAPSTMHSQKAATIMAPCRV